MPTSPRDIEAIYNAVRIRLSQAGSPSATSHGGVGPPGPPGPQGPKGVVWKGAWALAQPYEVGDIVTHPTPVGAPCYGGALLSYFCLFAEESNPTNEPVPGGTPGYWHELTSGALLVDGSRAMTCNLNMDEHEVDNVGAIDFTLGPVPAHVHAEGGAHWDDGFRLPTLDVQADAGVFQIPVPSVYLRVVNLYGFTILAGRAVRITGTYSGGLQSIGLADQASYQGDDVAGVTLHDFPSGQIGWICTRGHMRSPGAFAGLGGTYYLSSGGTLSNPPDSDQKGCYSTVRVGHAVGDDDSFIVDIERVPRVRALSDVQDVDASCGDVLVRQINPNSGCEQWTPSGLWTEVVSQKRFDHLDGPLREASVLRRGASVARRGRGRVRCLRVLVRGRGWRPEFRVPRLHPLAAGTRGGALPLPVHCEQPGKLELLLQSGLGGQAHGAHSGR
jgi:hypothetical protein